jgi:hypothetical protein
MTEKMESGFLEVVVPVADYQDAVQPSGKHAPRPSSIKGKTVLLLPSERSSSPPFIHALAARLTEQTAVRRAFVHNPDWPFFHPQRAGKIAAEVDKLARQCDLVVAGVGY